MADYSLSGVWVASNATWLCTGLIRASGPIVDALAYPMPPPLLRRWQRQLPVRQLPPVPHLTGSGAAANGLANRRRTISSRHLAAIITDADGCSSQNDRSRPLADIRDRHMLRRMTPFLLCIALSTSALGGIAFTEIDPTLSLLDQAALPPPPPATEISDPTEGPFIVRLNAQNEVGSEQFGVVRNAVVNWLGEKLQAFQICYSQRGQIDWNASNAAMMTVSRELKLQGARTVIAPNGLICRSPHRPNVPGAYVEINGVVLF
jgi:hypothetical protein